MRVASTRPTLAGLKGVVEVDAPQDASLLSATIDQFGAVVLHWLARGEGDRGQASPLLLIWHGEECLDTDPAEWQHRGCLQYPNGRTQHVFAPVEKPRVRKRAAKRGVDTDAAP